MAVYRSVSNPHLSFGTATSACSGVPRVAQLIMPYARFSVIIRSADW